MIAPVSVMGTEMLDRDASMPLYLQLAGLLRARIESGEWKPGQKIPSENELNRLYGVSRMTARQVLAQLVNEDLLFRVQGKGTFVAHRKISTRSPAYMGIREQLEGMGYAVDTKVLANHVVRADERVARALRIMPGERVHEIRRLRLLPDDEPISLHTSYVPTRLAPRLDADDLVARQLCVVLEEDHGLRMSKVSESLESTLPTAQEARALKIRRTTPLLLLTHEIADPAARLFEFSRILFRGDKLRLQFHYDL
jgi:GntR family transcriptional regulator